MTTPERSRDASRAETATRDAMTTTNRAPFDPSELSREAREKMALLERRMTSVERCAGQGTRGRGAARFAVEDGDRSDSRERMVEDGEASSSSSGEEAEDGSAYGVVASGGKSATGDAAEKKRAEKKRAGIGRSGGVGRGRDGGEGRRRARRTMTRRTRRRRVKEGWRGRGDIRRRRGSERRTRRCWKGLKIVDRGKR